MIIIVWSIMKNYLNSFRHTIFQIRYAICSTSIFFCIMTRISNIQIFIFKCFFTYCFLCINNESFFIRFLVLVKFLDFSVMRRHIYITKICIFKGPLMWSKFFFVLKEWRQFRQWKCSLFFIIHLLFLLTMLMIILLQDNAVVSLCLKSLKEKLVYTIWVMFWNISRTFFFHF